MIVEDKLQLPTHNHAIRQSLTTNLWVEGGGKCFLTLMLENYIQRYCLLHGFGFAPCTISLHLSPPFLPPSLSFTHRNQWLFFFTCNAKSPLCSMIIWDSKHLPFCQTGCKRWPLPGLLVEIMALLGQNKYNYTPPPPHQAKSHLKCDCYWLLCHRAL